MHAWEQIQKTVDYIEAHIGQEVDIEELAKMAALSPFYYQRLFKRLVKKPVGEYQKLRRMAKAAEMLLDRDKRILDIALETGFSSHESFTRAFKRTFGITPDSYRREPRALTRMTKPELLLSYVLIDEGVPLITDGIVLEIGRRQQDKPINCIGLDHDHPIAFAEGPGTESGVDPLDALWNSFHERKTAELGLDVNGEEIDVTLPSDKDGCMRYFAGAPDWVGAPPSGFKTWVMPEGEYIVCSFEAESFEALVMDALFKAEQYLFNIWLPKHSIKTDMFCAERYPTHGAGTTAMEVWVRVVE